jgi:hypothetical protein
MTFFSTLRWDGTKYSSQWNGFAKQSQSTTMERRCEKKPFCHKGLALLRKANHHQHPHWTFAKQSQPVTKDWLCEAKPINHDGNNLRSNPNFSQRIGFAKQSQSITKDWLGFAKQSRSIHHKGSAF